MLNLSATGTKYFGQCAEQTKDMVYSPFVCALIITLIIVIVYYLSFAGTLKSSVRTLLWVMILSTAVMLLHDYAIEHNHNITELHKYAIANGGSMGKLTPLTNSTQPYSMDYDIIGKGETKPKIALPELKGGVVSNNPNNQQPSRRFFE